MASTHIMRRVTSLSSWNLGHFVASSADMPELPEVESARKFVEQHCEGLEIVDVTVADDDSTPPPFPFRPSKR